MATVNARIEDDNHGGVLITWETITDTNLDGGAVNVGKYTDMTVHSDGNYGGGASVAMQGSNNNVAWFALTSPGGDAIALTADTVGALIVEQPKYIRCLNDAGGDSNTDIDVYVHAKKLPRY